MIRDKLVFDYFKSLQETTPTPTKLSIGRMKLNTGNALRVKYNNRLVGYWGGGELVDRGWTDRSG